MASSYVIRFIGRLTLWVIVLSELNGFAVTAADQVRAAESNLPLNGVSGYDSTNDVMPAENVVSSVTAVAVQMSSDERGVQKTEERDSASRQSAEPAVSNGPVQGVNGSETNAAVPGSKKPLCGMQSKRANNGMAIVAVMVLAVVLTISGGALRWFLSARYRVLANRLLKARAYEGSAALDAVCGNNRRYEKVLTCLRGRLDTAKSEDERGDIFEAILAMAGKSEDKPNYQKYLDAAFCETSTAVRLKICNRIVRCPTDEVIKRLCRHLSVEGDTQIRTVIMSTILHWKENELHAFMTKECFDAADECIRVLACYGLDDEKVAEHYKRVATLRARKISRQLELDLEERQVKAAKLVSKASKRLGSDQVDDIEGLLKQAIQEYPGNEEAQRLLQELPELRSRFSAALISKNEADRLKESEEHRVSARELLTTGALDKAATDLLALVSLVPSDAWGQEALQKLPALQEQKRQAEHDREINEKKERIGKIKVQFYTQWDEENFSEAKKTILEWKRLAPQDAEVNAVSEKIEESLRLRKLEAVFAEIEDQLAKGNFNDAESRLLEILKEQDQHDRISAVIARIPELRQMRDSAAVFSEKEKQRKAFSGLRSEIAVLLADGKIDKAEKLVTELAGVSPELAEFKTTVDIFAHEIQRQKVEKIVATLNDALSSQKYDEADQLLRILLVLDIGESHRFDEFVKRIDLLRFEDNKRDEQKAATALAEKKIVAVEKIRIKVIALFETNRFEEASVACNEWISLAPSDADALALADRIMEAIMRVKVSQAYEAVEQALKKDDFDGAEQKLRTLLVYADEMRRVDDILERLPTLRAVVDARNAREKEEQIQKQMEKARLDALALCDQDKFNDAVQVLDVATKTFPLCGELKALKDNINKAVQDRQINDLRNHVSALLEKADFEKAESILRSLMAVRPSDESERLLCLLPEMKRKHQESITASEESNSERSAMSALKEAQKFLESGDFSKSATKLRRSIALDPTNDKAALLLQRLFQIDRLAAGGVVTETEFDQFGQIVGGKS